MLYSFDRLFIIVTAIVFLWMLSFEAWTILAAVVPPEAVRVEEEPKPSEIAPELERTPRQENPFEKSNKPDLEELLRRNREKRTIYIILGVVILLCVYWWTSGKLHHKLPKVRR